ncbi:MAG: peptide deformylase, partial [Flavobacteriaceae bacterium]
MILPIVAYGDPVLRKLGKDVKADHPGIKALVTNMWETMYNAHGVGLAAPQVGTALRLFIVDTTPFSDDEELSVAEQETLDGFKKVFINAQIQEETGNDWSFNEGCLSIP